MHFHALAAASCFTPYINLWFMPYLQIYLCLPEIRCHGYLEPIGVLATISSLHGQERVSPFHFGCVTQSLYRVFKSEHRKTPQLTLVLVNGASVNSPHCPISIALSSIIPLTLLQTSTPLLQSSASRSSSQHQVQSPPLKSKNHGIPRHYTQRRLLPKPRASNSSRALPLLPKRRRHLRRRRTHRRHHPRHAQALRSCTAMPRHRNVPPRQSQSPTPGCVARGPNG